MYLFSNKQEEHDVTHTEHLKTEQTIVQQSMQSDKLTEQMTEH